MVFTIISGDVSVGRNAHGGDSRRFCCALLAVLLAAVGLLPRIGFADAVQLRVVVADAKGAPLPDAVVTLRSPGSSGGAAARTRLPLPAEPIIIQQLDREFVPRVTVIPVGARVSLPNNDAVPHSVYSFSAAKQFEFDVYVGSSPQVLTLDKVGIITLGCNIHDWMVGYIVVVDTPFARRSDARGAVSFTAVPEGDYELRVWHPQQRSRDHVAQLSLSEPSQTKTITVDVAPARVRYKPPLTLKRY